MQKNKFENKNDSTKWSNIQLYEINIYVYVLGKKIKKYNTIVKLHKIKILNTLNIKYNSY